MTTSHRATSSLFLFICGIIPASFAIPRTFTSLSAILLFLVYVLCLRFPQALVPLVIASFLTGFAYCTIWRSHAFTTFPAQFHTTHAVIVEPPDIRAGSILLTILPQGVHGRVLLITDRYPIWHYGDEISFDGSSKAPEVFNGFNYPLYLERFGIYTTVPKPTHLHLLAHNRGSPILASLYILRGYWENTIQHTVPEPESSFLAGILLGSKRTIPGYIQDALRQTGTSHIIAISGANITIVLGLLLQILPSGTPQKRFNWTISVAIFITILTGASASVLRGAIVAIVGAYLRLRSRQARATPLILVCATILLFNNPLLLTADPGFQLSFAAFAGLAYLSKPIHTLVGKWHLPQAIKGAFVETTAATLGTSILSLHTFGQLSLIGLVVNPLVLWPLPFVTILGLVLIACGWIPGISLFLRLPLWILLHGMLAIIQYFSRLPFGVIHLTAANVP